MTISGEKKSERKEKDLSFYRTERIYGSFSRSFTIPGEINPDTVDAKFEDGILKVVVGKVKEKNVSGRLINIK